MSDYLESAIVSRLLTGAMTLDQLGGISSDWFEHQRDVVEWLIRRLGQDPVPPSTHLVQARFPEWHLVNPTDTNDDLLDAFRHDVRRRWLVDDLSVAFDKVGEGQDGVEQALEQLTLALGKYVTPESDVVNLADSERRLATYQKRVDAIAKGGGIGIPTGFPSFDSWTHGGLQAGDYYLVMGDTNVGKTWMALTLAIRAWKGGYPPLYVSLEGTEEAMGFRFDTLVSSIPNSELFLGTVPVDIYKHQIEADKKETKFWLAMQGSRMEYTPGQILQLAATLSPKLVVADYLTLMTLPGEDADDWRVAASISRYMKSLALYKKVPVIGVIQGTRQSGQKSTLELDDIAISYAIARPADMVLGLTKIKGGLKVELLKGRHTQTAGQDGAKAKFYVATDWNIGDVHQDTRTLLA